LDRLAKEIQPALAAVLSDINVPGMVHGIAEEAVTLNDDVADMQPDPKSHLLTLRSIRILLGYGALHRDCTVHGIDSAGEISDDCTASRSSQGFAECIDDTGDLMPGRRSGSR
jgi:hypothetical protein